MELVYASKAEQQFRKAAEAGDAIAQNQLGYCYYIGNGVHQDYAEAVKWIRKSAEQGNAAAQNSLGGCYFFGHGVMQDLAEAARWYRKAAPESSWAKRNLEELIAQGVVID